MASWQQWESRLRRARRLVKKGFRRVLLTVGLFTVPYLYVAYMELVYRTSRVEHLGFTPGDMRVERGGGVWAVWHDEVFFVAFAFRRWKADTLASPGDAGAIITRMLELCDFNVFRGGSTTGRRRRSSTDVMRQMIDHFKEERGVLYGITTDGSKGPAYRMKHGAVLIAVRSGGVIGVEKTWCKRYLQLPTWDRTMIPLPFNHIVHAYSGPIVPDETEHEGPGFEALCERVERQLCRVSAYARRRVEGRPPPREWLERFPEAYREEMARVEDLELRLDAGEPRPAAAPPEPAS